MGATCEESWVGLWYTKFRIASQFVPRFVLVRWWRQMIVTVVYEGCVLVWWMIPLVAVIWVCGVAPEFVTAYHNLSAVTAPGLHRDLSQFTTTYHQYFEYIIGFCVAAELLRSYTGIRHSLPQHIINTLNISFIFCVAAEQFRSCTAICHNYLNLSSIPWIYYRCFVLHQNLSQFTSSYHQ